MKRYLFKDDQTLATVQTDSFAKEMNSILAVTMSGSYTLSFGDITLVRGLYLELDQDALVAIKGAAPIQMRKLADGTVAKLFIEAEINQVIVTNPSATTAMNGIVCAWGDPTA
jgi:hypothetical protein